MSLNSLLGSENRGFLLAVVAALAMVFAVLAATDAGAYGTGGGVGPDTTSDRSTSTNTSSRYERLYRRTTTREKRWARRTAECESGGNPRAIGGGGAYRGAFQFLRSSWNNAPKSPGGDPIRYTYRTQAVVAIHLKRQMGTKPWPVCG
jgi:transglycosylase-like protein